MRYYKSEKTNDILYSDLEVNDIIDRNAKKLGIDLKRGMVHSSDVFYKENDNFQELYEKYNCLACEMETFALFHNANVLKKRASAIVTISDSLVTNEVTSSEERQNSFKDMMKIALETAIEL